MTAMNKWDSRYSEKGFAYGVAPNDFLKQNVEKFPKGGKLLCLAEGEGRNAVFLARQGFEIVAVDSSTVGLEKAQKMALTEKVKITTIVADLAEFIFEENNFDGVVSIFCHLPPPLRKRVNNEIIRCLKPGGILLLEAYTPKQLEYKTGGPKNPELMLSLDTLQDEFSELAPLHSIELEREINEGHLHTGLGAVVQFIAEK